MREVYGCEGKTSCVQLDFTQSAQTENLLLQYGNRALARGKAIVAGHAPCPYRMVATNAVEEQQSLAGGAVSVCSVLLDG